MILLKLSPFFAARQWLISSVVSQTIYKLYLDKLESKKNGGSFFDGLGTDVKREKLSIENNTVEKEDLSWLEQL